jgi:tetratricopeptide (TPR) repeat protein
MDDNEVDAREQELLTGLEQRFLKALADKDEGRLDEAEDALRDILKVEPRLPEAHLELARLLLDTDRFTDAEPHAREAITWLEQGGQWTDEVPEEVLQALAHALLAEILRRRADDDDVIFGDPAAFRALVDEAKRHFARAAELDPSDEYSSYHAFFLGVPGAQPTIGAVDVDATPGEDADDDAT